MLDLRLGLASALSHLQPGSALAIGVSSFLGLGDSSTFADFQRLVPPTSKQLLFKTETSALLSKIEKGGFRSRKIVLAAGSSGAHLGFRVDDPSWELKRFEQMSKKLFEMWNLSPQDTLIINAYPLGISLPTAMFSVETGPRPEMIARVLSLSEGRPVILLCQPLLLRCLAVTGILQSTNSKTLHAIVGGYWQPAAFGTFLSSLVEQSSWGIDQVVSLFGAAEVGLGIGIQTPDASRARLIGDKDLMHFELTSDHHLVEVLSDTVHITKLGENFGLPIIRYNLGDSGAFSSDNQLLVKSRDSLDAVEIQNCITESSDIFRSFYGSFRLSTRFIEFDVLPNFQHQSRAEGILKNRVPNLGSISFKKLPAEQLDLIRKPRFR